MAVPAVPHGFRSTFRDWASERTHYPHEMAEMALAHTIGNKVEGRLVYFMSVENARFRKLVVPGDQLRVHVERIHKRGNVWKFKGEAKVEGVVCAEAVYTAMIVDE